MKRMMCVQRRVGRCPAVEFRHWMAALMSSHALIVLSIVSHDALAQQATSTHHESFVPSSSWKHVNVSRQAVEGLAKQPEKKLPSRYGEFIPSSRWGGSSAKSPATNPQQFSQVLRRKNSAAAKSIRQAQAKQVRKNGLLVRNHRTKSHPSYMKPHQVLNLLGTQTRTDQRTAAQSNTQTIAPVVLFPPAPVNDSETFQLESPRSTNRLQSREMIRHGMSDDYSGIHNAGPHLETPSIKQAARIAERVKQESIELSVKPGAPTTSPIIPPQSLVKTSSGLAQIDTSLPSQIAFVEDTVKLAQFKSSDSIPDPSKASNETNLDFHSDMFEVIQSQSEPITIHVGRSLLLRTRNDIFRTAVVDPTVCDIMQFTPSEVSIIGRSVGVTNTTFWFRENGGEPMNFEVRVIPDPDRRRTIEENYHLLEQLLAHLFPDSKVLLIPMANKLIVKGQAKDAEEAAQILHVLRAESGGTGQGRYGLNAGRATRVLTDEETGGQRIPEFDIVNMLKVPGAQQVALRVKIAELNRSAARGFGVDLDAEVNYSDTASTFIRSMLNMAAGGSPSVITQFDGDDITVGLRWLEEEGVVRMLSEPTLVTLSGRPATFVAGGEFAVPTIVGAGGVSAVTTDYRAFGAIISFLPIVIDKDRIRLQVSPEFSQINTDLNVGDNLGLDVRAVTTTVEMREGQTLAIAGLLDDTMKGDKIGDLPVLSHVFGRRGTSHSETELIILVTPELIHPMEPEEVPPLPGFDVTDPNNTEFFIQGHLEGIPTRNYHSTAWPRLRRRYQGGGPAMISGPFGHGQ